MHIKIFFPVYVTACYQLLVNLVNSLCTIAVQILSLCLVDTVETLSVVGF